MLGRGRERVCVNVRGLRKYNNSPAVSVSRKVWRVEPARGKGDRDQSVREEKRGRKWLWPCRLLAFVAWRCRSHTTTDRDGEATADQTTPHSLTRHLKYRVWFVAVVL